MSRSGGRVLRVRSTSQWKSWRRSAPHLQLVFLLGGAAVALAFLSVDLLTTRWVWSLDAMGVVGRVLLITAVFVIPPTLVGLLQQIRQIETLAAAEFLGPDIQRGGDNGRWAERVRACLWFWCHLVTGTAVAVGAIGCVAAVVELVAAPWRSRGTPLLGAEWLTAHDDGRDLLYPLIAVVLIAVYALALAIAGQVLVALAPVLLGASYEERLEALERRTIDLVNRSHLAGELHDSVGHAMSVVILQAAAAQRRIRSDPEAAEQGIQESISAARRAQDELDHVLRVLRNGEPRSAAPTPDLGSLAELISAAQSSTAGHIEVVDDEVNVAQLPPVISRESFRILQEALTNALRHADGVDIHVTVSQARDVLKLNVANEIRPTRWRRQQRSSFGHGVLGIRERAQLLGGRVAIGPSDDSWIVDVQLPLTNEGFKR